jgi:hypothetical protein
MVAESFPIPTKIPVRRLRAPIETRHQFVAKTPKLCAITSEYGLMFGDQDYVDENGGYVKRRRRTPGFQPETQKIQVLHPVSLRSQKAILSLPQLYRICTELPEHAVLSYFPLFIFEVICWKSEMLRLVRTSAITALHRT